MILSLAVPSVMDLILFSFPFDFCITCRLFCRLLVMASFVALYFAQRLLKEKFGVFKKITRIYI